MNSDLFDVEMVDNVERRMDLFTLEDVLNDLKGISDFSGARQLDVQVYTWLKDSGLVYEIDNAAVTSFLPKRAFFEGVQFRITPKEREIKDGILIAGHRFLPFTHREKPSFLCRMSEGKRMLRYKTVQRPVRELIQFYSLFGWQGMMQQFVEDQPANADALLNEDEAKFYDAVMTCTVFDMADFYERHEFKPGDSLVLTVHDWYTGQFGVKYSKAAELDGEFEKCRIWCEALEKSLLQVFEKDGVLTDVYEQMSHAYFLGGNDLAGFAGLSMGPYLEMSSTIKIAPLASGVTILWYADQKPEDRLAEFMEEDLQNTMTGRTDSLNAIMQDMGLSSSEIELEARMRDELYRGGQSLERVLERMFHGLDQVMFATDLQSEAFFELSEELWDRTVANYNRFMDVNAGPGRVKVLEIIDRQISWLRSLDQRQISPEALPGQEIFLFGQITAMLETTLRLLNAPDEVSKEEIIEVTDELDQVGTTVDRLIATMDSIVENGHCEPELRVLDLTDGERLILEEGDIEEEDEPVIYQLKVSLQGAKPPIWRRILVPRDIPLDILHTVIQISFGWENEHLHLYRTRWEMIGDPEALEMDCVPEYDIELKDVLRQEKERMDYVYDLGDDWTHRIVLEKILERDADRIYPACVGGRRAGPPENCGGVPGYMMMLEACGDPNHPSHAGFMEWLGDDFDAAKTNIKEVNNLFKEWRI